MQCDGPTYPPLIHSFFMGGFECATHLRRDGRRVDVIGDTLHDRTCVDDYRLLAKVGIHTVRDGLRWHLIEKIPNIYDWQSFLPMLHAAHTTGMQVVWDLSHWGVPDWLDIFSPDFVTRFANFAAAAATLIHQERLDAGLIGPPLYCAINEISFWAWVGGDVEHFGPFQKDRGSELKQQLVRASIAAIRAVRGVDPAARFVQAEPAIQISVNPLDTTRDLVADAKSAAAHTAAQFEVWDMIAGLRHPELGGTPDLLDVIGINYYWNNQWIHDGPRVPLGHLQHRALHAMLYEIWTRYQRPMIITETGAEHDASIGWLGYISAEVRRALRMGVPVLGICIYPVMDYPGWDDDRHCPCGLIESSSDWSSRHLRTEFVAELEIQQGLFRTVQQSNPLR